jgi:hypothetical protein
MIPCVAGRPIRSAIPPGVSVEVSWPNAAGVCEDPRPDDIVLWDRSLAAQPPRGSAIPYGRPADPRVLNESKAWFSRFVRRLEQIPSINRACGFDVARAVLLTPGSINQLAMPAGVARVPEHLGEFPGGIVVTLYPHQWTERDRYAATIETWFRSQRTQ